MQKIKYFEKKDRKVAKAPWYTGVDPGFPVGGGAPTLVGGGANLRHRCFSVKTYVKTKEFGPVGGGGACRKLLYVDLQLV